MSTVSSKTWRSGWTVSDAPEIGFVSVPADAEEWEPGPWPGFESLDLGLNGVSDGMFDARRIRAASSEVPRDTPWHCHDVDYEFLFVVSGSVTIETDEGEHYTLGPGAAGNHPALFWHREYHATPDLEYVRIIVPAESATIEGRGSELPSRAHDLGPDRRPSYTFDQPEAYVLGAGPRSYFKYRDLGTLGATDGRIHIHIVRATEPGPGTGWHYHTMAQWFLILGGSSVIRIEDMPKDDLTKLDTMCIGRGPSMRHNVAPYSGDYAVLEMCVPAVYETIAVPPPENADSAPENARE